MAGDVNRSVGVKVTGAKELRRAINKAEDTGLKDALKEAHKRAATIVKDRGYTLAPVVSGDLRDSIRTGGGVASAIVSVGRGKTLDYARIVYRLDNHQFIHDAIHDKWREVYDSYTDSIDHMTRKI